MTWLRIPTAYADFTPGAAADVKLPGDLPKLILGVINTAIVLAGVMTLGYLVYGGFRYLTSRGDEDDTRTAKNTITYAIVGLVVIAIAAAIVNFVFGAF